MKKWTTAAIRQAFIDYFNRQEHLTIASSPLLPANDPTLLFTNAGMVQFKGVFLGKEKPKAPSAVTTQRCIRASGKHNDLENVGYTNRHHTFFEMMGNFSFGDYFKQEAIHYAWEFLTKDLEIDPGRLWITVHKDDKEAEELWKKEFARTNTKPQGIGRCGDEDNFWSMGETGPCGYCSEIFYDHGEKFVGSPPGCGTGDGDERYVEIWNLVFMQFERDAKGKLNPLPKPSIDTGMGLERIAAAMQGVNDNYEIDIFSELHDRFIASLKKQFEINPETLKSDSARIASRVVADHIRSAVFLIAEGVIPSNEKAGYVLRSIIRRAVYYIYRLGVRHPFFFQITYSLVDIFGDVYPEAELRKRQDQIASTIEQEEIKFLDTLDRGLKILESEIAKLKGKTIPGKVAFVLHDTYGLPIILTTELARERGLNLDKKGFDIEMEKQRETSRAASKFEATKLIEIDFSKETKFVGYIADNSKGTISGLFAKDGLALKSFENGAEGLIILDETPFYAESGGQVGDTGEIYSEDGVFIVQDTQKQGDTHLHYGYMTKGCFKLNDKVTAQIDTDRRQAIKLNHSATHLLHKGLRSLLGDSVMQKGSYVDDKRLRFDFTYSLAVTPLELNEVERLVNSQIRANLGVKTAIQSINDAKTGGALAFFGEKYAESVRVVSMGDFSKELCGGVHVANTGEIGVFKIVSESGIAAGIRRIEAVTGENALIRLEKIEQSLEQIAGLLGVNLDQVIDKTKQIYEEYRFQAKEIETLQNKLMGNQSKKLINNAIKINGFALLSVKIPDVDSKALRQMVDSLKQEMKSGIIVLATTKGDKAQLIVGVTKDLVSRFKANEVLQHITKQIDGSGGGRADMAQGGGANTEALQKALDSVLPWIEEKL